MQFQHTYQQVMDGSKTETSRLLKPEDSFQTDETGHVIKVWRGSRILWEVGKTYAVQPGRGKAAVGRIKLLAIRHDPDRRDIGYIGAMKEGFDSPAEFIETWCRMHDPKVQLMYFNWDRVQETVHGYKHWTHKTGADWADLDDREFLQLLASRPAELYDVWVLTFALAAWPAAEPEIVGDCVGDLIDEYPAEM
jgi:hypothetical protein